MDKGVDRIWTAGWWVISWLIVGATSQLGAQTPPVEVGSRVRVAVVGTLPPPLDHRWFLVGPLTYWASSYLEVIDEREQQIVRVSREQVAKLEVSTGRANHSGTGLLIGGLAGALLGLMVHEDNTDSGSFQPRGRWVAAWGAAIGAGVGFVVGAARPGAEGWQVVALERGRP